MTILAVGSVALDAIETPYGSRDPIVGGSATFFSYAASFFVPVRVVAVVGSDFPESAIAMLKGRGIDLDGLQRAPGKTFRWSGRYDATLTQRVTLETCLNVFETFRPEIPEAYRDSRMVFLGNIDPGLQRSVLEQVRSPKLVVADTMNFWIDGQRQSLVETLKLVDVLIINEEEVRLLAGDHNIVRAAEAVRRLGPRILVVKRGEYGALLFQGPETFAATAFPLSSVVDPTGAGDTFAGGFIGSLAREGEITERALRRAVIYGSVVGSFSVEGFGLERLETLTAAEIDHRFAAFRKLVDFEPA
ncbi:MAG: sugar kinase [Deltaproteobacteria bacterium]|nr:sugar kinase [Deltaproteobacteria bacterium]